MKKYYLLAAMLLSGMLLGVGCSSDDDDSSADDAAAPAAAPDATSDDDSDAAPDANATFAAVTPSGIKQTDKFVIAGRGTALAVVCDAISGAASYTFTSSFGASETSPTPATAFLATAAQAGASYTLSVYATNGDGINTKTGSATVN